MGQQASAPALQEVESDFFDGRRTEVVLQSQRPGVARPLWPWEQSQPCYGPGAGETSFTAYPRIEARPMRPVAARPNTAAPEISGADGRGLADDGLWARRASKETLPPGPPSDANPWSPTGYRHHEVRSARAASPPPVSS